MAGALGRTERWVFQWLSRYDPQDEGWACSRSRAPLGGAHDLIVAATAVSLGCAVATRDRRHFRAIPGLRLIEL